MVAFPGVKMAAHHAFSRDVSEGVIDDLPDAGAFDDDI
jgi:hypothetical protein